MQARLVVALLIAALPAIAVGCGAAHDTVQHAGAVRLHVTQSIDRTGPLPIEGALSYVRVENENGKEVVEERLSREGQASIRLDRGSYRVISYQRTCDGNCGSLDPASDRCAREISLSGDEAVTASVRVRYGSGCTIRFRSTGSPPGLTAEKLARLRESAITAAASMGEKHPTGGIEVATTQHGFFDAMPNGPRVYGDDFEVYVVGFEGKLTASGASRPRGAPVPKGRFAYAVHRAETLDVTDGGLLKEPLDLTRFGPFVRLDLESGS